MLISNIAVSRYTTFDGYSESVIKGYIHPFRITCDKSAVNLLESREQRYIKQPIQFIVGRR